MLSSFLYRTGKILSHRVSQHSASENCVARTIRTDREWTNEWGTVGAKGSHTGFFLSALVPPYSVCTCVRRNSNNNNSNGNNGSMCVLCLLSTHTLTKRCAWCMRARINCEHTLSPRGLKTPMSNSSRVAVAEAAIQAVTTTLTMTAATASTMTMTTTE